MGQVEDAYSFVHYGGFNAASIWGGDASASGSRIRAERTGDGFRITDLDGKDCGTIHVDDPEDFTYAEERTRLLSGWHHAVRASRAYHD